MRKVFFSFLLSLLAPLAHAAYQDQFGHGTTAGLGVTSNTASMTASAGATAIVAVVWAQNSGVTPARADIFSVGDGGTNTYTLVDCADAATVASTSQVAMCMYKVTAVVGGTVTITADTRNNANTTNLTVAWVSYFNFGAQDQFGELGILNQSAAQTVTTNGTLAASDETIVSFWAGSSAFAPDPASLTLETSWYSGKGFDQYVIGGTSGSTASATATPTGSLTGTAVIITFKSAPSAISFVGAADLGNNSGSTNNYTTAAYTVGGSSNLLAVCLVGDTGGTHDDITGVTQAGGCTLSLAAKSASASQNRNNYLYYCLGPATGAHTINVTSTASHYLIVMAADYAGVQQSAQPDATHTDISASSLTFTTSITSVANKSWELLCTDGTSVSSWKAGAGLEQRAHDGAFNTGAFFDSAGIIMPAGAYSVTETHGASGVVAHVAATFSPVGAGSMFAGPARLSGPTFFH